MAEWDDAARNYLYTLLTEMNAPKKNADCPDCGDKGAINVYELPDGEKMIVRASLEPEFVKKYPAARIESVLICPCVERKQAARLTQAGKIPDKHADCSFEWFDALPERWREGKEQARQIMEILARETHVLWQGKRKCAVCLSGRNGRGKSGLAAAAMNVRMAAGQLCLWTDAGKFLDNCAQAQQRQFEKHKEGVEDSAIGNVYDYAERVATVPFLVLDDLGSARKKTPMTDFQEARIYTIIRERYEQQLPYVIPTNLRLEQIYEQFGDRIGDRIFETCHWVEVGGENLRHMETGGRHE